MSEPERRQEEKAFHWLHRIAGSNAPRAWGQLQATENVKTNADLVKPPGGLQFATRRAKFEGAKREGASKEETVAAAFEAMHAEPEKRLQLLKKIKVAFEKVSAKHRTPAKGFSLQ